MRPAAVLLVAAVMVAPAALAWNGPYLNLVSARLETIWEPFRLDWIPPGNHYELTFTVRNDGAAGTTPILVDEWWIITDLPGGVWWDDFTFDAGEERTFVVDIDFNGNDNGNILAPGPSWLCLNDVGPSSPSRCWSILQGARTPDGAYPEDLPHWQLQGVPMGDMP